MEGTPMELKTAFNSYYKHVTPMGLGDVNNS